MAKNTAKTKKVKDLDPKGKTREVKGGRQNVLSDDQRELVRRVAKRVTGRPH